MVKNIDYSNLSDGSLREAYLNYLDSDFDVDNATDTNVIYDGDIGHALASEVLKRVGNPKKVNDWVYYRPNDPDLDKESFKRQAIFNKKNNLRIKAASAGDAQTFYELCEELGVKPEEPYLDLHIQGAFLKDPKQNPLEKGLSEVDPFLEVKNILSKTNPYQIYNATNQRQLLTGIFSQLRKQGVNINKSKKMNSSEMLNQYMSFMKQYDVL
mgnify:FL=1